MLVLSRKVREKIVINSDIILEIVEIRGDKVRLGIVAPKNIPVHRQEVYERIKGEGDGTSNNTGPAKNPAGVAEPVGAGV